MFFEFAESQVEDAPLFLHLKFALVKHIFRVGRTRTQ